MQLDAGRAASRSMASVNDNWSICWTNEMTSPPTPHPKQWKNHVRG